MALALLIARLLLGISLFAHGTQKLFGWFHGYGLKGTGGFFESLGFRPGTAFAALAGLGESVGGLLTVLGLGGPVGPALIIVVMIVAALTVHLRNGYFATNNGYELPTMNVAAALALAFAGPGLYSLDAAFGIDGVWTDPLRWSIVLIAVVLGIITPLARRASQAQPAA